MLRHLVLRRSHTQTVFALLLLWVPWNLFLIFYGPAVLDSSLRDRTRAERVELSEILRKRYRSNVTSAPYSVSVLSIPSRMQQARENLAMFPSLHMILGPNRSQLDLANLVHNGTLYPPTWDFADHRMLRTYNVPYPTEGAVGCLLGHRRILQDMLQHRSSPVLLVLEDDAVPNNPHIILQQIDDLLRLVPVGWDYIQLGRCWDINCANRTTQPLFRLGNVNLYESRGYELCSHGYLITRHGAKKLLRHSLPMLLPYVSKLIQYVLLQLLFVDVFFSPMTICAKDHLQMLLIRTGILKGYFTSPRLFLQSGAFQSAIVDESPGAQTCDPTRMFWAGSIYKKLREYDPLILEKINRN